MNRHCVRHSLIVWVSIIIMLVLSEDFEMSLDLSRKVVANLFPANTWVPPPDTSSGGKGLGVVALLFSFLLLRKRNCNGLTSSHPDTEAEEAMPQTLRTSVWPRSQQSGRDAPTLDPSREHKLVKFPQLDSMDFGTGLCRRDAKHLRWTFLWGKERSITPSR